MDIFFEYLVKKKSSEDTLKKVGIVIACIFICFLILFISFFVCYQLITFSPILIAAVIFGAVKGVQNFSVEYEYVFTNGVLDIDIIKGKSKRKNLISVPCKKIDYMGKITNSYSSSNLTVNAIYDIRRSGKYVITFSDDGVLTDVLFQPPEKLLINMKKYNPKNINL